MADGRGLEGIQDGSGTVAEARAAVAAHLSCDGYDPNRLYVALRSRVWAMLDGRSREPGELRGWYEILRRVSAFMSDSHPTDSARVRVLSDLLYESISVADTLRPETMLERSHQRDMIRILAAGPEVAMPERDLASRIDVHPNFFHRFLRACVRSGLVEVVGPEGDRAVRLGWEGREAARRLSADPDVPEVPAPG